MRAIYIVALLLGACVLTNQAYHDRVADRAVDEDIRGADRFVDVSVRLHVVVADPTGDVQIEGKPRMRILRTTYHGGIVDTRSAGAPVAWTEACEPLDWYCSEDQEIALKHRGAPYAQLVYGSEGAGKTRLLVMWHYFRWLEHLGEFREGGQTAPTLARLGLVKLEMLAAFRPNWAKYVARDEFEGFEMCDGTRIRFRYAHQQSAAKGRPIQGFNWSWCGRDEMQDQVDAHEDIESRGRSSKDGRYPQLGTATAKDSTAWRDLRDVILASGQWARRSLSIFRTPFVDQRFIETKKATMTTREFLRRYGDPVTGEVSDLQPELAVYYSWMRSRNLMAMPRIATDVTASVLTQYRPYTKPRSRFTIVCSHDPGNIYNATTIQRLLIVKGLPTWVVVGELWTKQTTAGEHARQLKDLLQTKFGVEFDDIDAPKAAIFCDPHGKGESQTDYQTVYMAFQHAGLDVFNPAPMSGKIKRAARVGMVNRLLCDARNEVRLVVATDEHGRPVAPNLVEAFETLQKKDGDDNAEGTRSKDEADKTHAPAALSYGLWPFEQEAFTAMTIKTALAEAKKYG